MDKTGWIVIGEVSDQLGWQNPTDEDVSVRIENGLLMYKPINKEEKSA